MADTRGRSGEKEIVAEFSRLHPPSRYTRSVLSRLHQQLITQLSAGTAPDVLNVSEPPEGPGMELEVLTPRGTGADFDGFFLRVVDAGRFDGVAVGKGPLYACLSTPAARFSSTTKMFDS